MVLIASAGACPAAMASAQQLVSLVCLLPGAVTVQQRSCSQWHCLLCCAACAAALLAVCPRFAVDLGVCSTHCVSSSSSTRRVPTR